MKMLSEMQSAQAKPRLAICGDLMNMDLTDSGLLSMTLTTWESEAAGQPMQSFYARFSNVLNGAYHEVLGLFAKALDLDPHLNLGQLGSAVKAVLEGVEIVDSPQAQRYWHQFMLSGNLTDLHVAAECMSPRSLVVLVETLLGAFPAEKSCFCEVERVEVKDDQRDSAWKLASRLTDYLVGQVMASGLPKDIAMLWLCRKVDALMSDWSMTDLSRPMPEGQCVPRIEEILTRCHNLDGAAAGIIRGLSARMNRVSFSVAEFDPRLADVDHTQY